MGATDFTTFCELLRYRGGDNSALDSTGASNLNLYGVWINQSYRQLCSQDYILGLKKRLYFPQLLTSTTKTTTDGTAYVAVPSDCLFITEVFDTTNGKKLTHITWKQYVEYTDRTTAASEGDPSEWTRAGNFIYLHPTPDATMTVTVYYKKLPADLSGSATTDIGAEWDDAIIELATYKMFVWTHEDAAKVKQAKESFLEIAAGLADIYWAECKDRDESFGPSASYLS